MILNFIIAAAVFSGIVLFVLKKVILTDTSHSLDKLNAAVKRNEKLQLEIEQKMKDCEEACRKKIESAKEEASKILSDSRGKAAEEAKELLEKAKGQGEEVLQKATDAKEKIRKDIIREMDMKAIDIASRALVQILGQAVSEKFNEIVVEDFIRELPNAETKHIGEDVNRVEIISRYSLRTDLREKIHDILHKKLKRTLEVSEKADPAVLAGVMLKFGTMVIDGSLASKIGQFTEDLKKVAEK